jgi:cell volume regulation protein A
MIDAMLVVILVSAGLLVLSVVTSVVAFRLGAPLLLLFLGIGLLAGEDGIGGIPFDGSEEAFFVGSVAIAIILFTSGFETRWTAFRQAAAPAIVLATLGVVLTTGLVGVAARLILGLGWLEALLLGAIVGSTDAAAVFFLLRVGGITIRDRVRSTLEVESGSNDPMAIFLVVTLLELVVADAGLATVGASLLQAFALQMGLGLATGLAGGWVVVQVINRTALEPGLYPVAVMGGIAVLFAGTGLLGGSGFLAVYVAGLVVGNMPVRATPYLHRFQEGFTWLAQIVLFLTLGLLATPSTFGAILVPVVAVACVLIFVARPIAVGLCLWPFGFRRNEVVFMSFVGLRGAVSILFAILPITAGLEHGQLLFNAAFIVVLVSLVVQGWTIAPFARWLEVVVPPIAAPAERVELELPGTAQHELVVYHITDGSPVAKGQRLPRWARPALVVRDGRSLSVHLAGRLAPDDYVYIFTNPSFIPLLDRLFASRSPLADADREFYGELAIAPAAAIAAVARSYGITLQALSDEETVAAFLARQFDGRVEVADRLALGPIDLIVRRVDEQGEPVEIGLSLARVDDRPRLQPGPAPRLLARLRRLLGGSPRAAALRNALGVGSGVPPRRDD